MSDPLAELPFSKTKQLDRSPGEAKSGKAAVKVRQFYDTCLAQADAATPIGSAYPFVAVADGLAVLRIEDFRRLLEEAKRGTL